MSRIIGQAITYGSGGIDTSDATATATKILSGYTAYANDAKITGTMTNRGAWSTTASFNSSTAIPAGYHNGSGKIIVPEVLRYISWKDNISSATNGLYVGAAGTYWLVFIGSGLYSLRCYANGSCLSALNYGYQTFSVSLPANGYVYSYATGAGDGQSVVIACRIA